MSRLKNDRDNSSLTRLGERIRDEITAAKNRHRHLAAGIDCI
jgi:hypothetical protein